MIAWNALSQIVALGAVLIVQTAYMIVVARFLGPEDFGRFSFAWSIIQILLIGGDLGLHNTALRQISAAPADSMKFSTTFLWLKTVLTGFLMFVVLVLTLVLQVTFETRVVLVLFGMGMVCHSLSLVLNVIFQSHGRLYWASLNVFAIFAVQAGLGIVLLWWGGRLMALGFAYLIAAFLALVVNYAIFRKQVHPLRLKISHDWWEFAVKSLPVGLATFFHTISARIGITLLTLLAGPLPTGVFAAASRITLATSNIPIGIFSAILPVMASHQGQRDAVRGLFRRSLLVMIAIALPLSAFFYGFAPPLIGLLYGEEYQASVISLQILAWSLIPVFVGMAFSHVILSQDQLVRYLPVVTGVGMAVNIAANLFLIPRLGSEGAAMAVLITEVVLAVGYVLAVRRFKLGSDPENVFFGK